MSDPNRACLTCTGKLHASWESGKLYETCGKCGLSLVEGKPYTPPTDADAVTRQRLGFPVQADELKAAHEARAKLAASTK